jgi:hypothetical protein
LESLAEHCMSNASSKPATAFRVGEKYTHEEVYRGLAVGNAGGIRPCIGKDGELRRLVVMTSVPTARILSENPYHDRVEGDVLVYTAAGREGDQAISGMNKRLVEQLDRPFPIYGFQNIGSRRDKNLGSRRWEFLGLLQYLRHYKETQVDTRGKTREALIFEMHVHREPNVIAPKFDSKISAEVLHNFQKTEKPNKEDRAIVAHTLTLPPQFRPLGGLEAEQIRRVMLNLQPQKFEHLIKRVLESTGFEKVSVTRYSQDGGVDVNAFAGPIFWPARSLLVQVQAKRWLHTVGRREVAELRGSLQPFARGAIVTTSHYSKSAVIEAAEAGKNPIVLVDGHEFASIVGSLKIAIE